jgi:hypothetical protein
MGMPRAATKSADPEIIPGRKRNMAPMIRKLKLRHPELTDSEIAHTVGCNPSNVACVLKTFLGNRSELELRDFQENRAEVYDSVALRLIGSLSQATIAKASALQLVTAAAIMHDKAALLRGQPTGINVTALLDVVEAIKASRGQ